MIGRRRSESELIKEEKVITDPVAPDFASPNASIISYHTNITLRALKPEKALQVSILTEEVKKRDGLINASPKSSKPSVSF